MSLSILVTGGAGFIGSHLVDQLVTQGHSVKIYDNLEPQVHRGSKPRYLNRDAEFICADICDEAALDAALHGIDVIFHEAAMVGVGQSMYQPLKYTRINTLGAATLLEVVVNKHRDHIRKMVVAASMSEYGEGLCRCEEHGDLKPRPRTMSELETGRWELHCPECGAEVIPIPTPETAPINCTSVYALNKRDHEDYFLNVGRAFGIPTVALRYFNVYGTRQSLSNPYTGVAAIFISRLKAARPPVIFEDGKQTRDFVSVHDIVSANISVMEDPRADYQVFNVGSGQRLTIVEIANLLGNALGSPQRPQITNKYRKGDIRHCFADVSKIEAAIGWRPKVEKSKGFAELIEWSDAAESIDLFDQAELILKQKGVI